MTELYSLEVACTTQNHNLVLTHEHTQKMLET